MPRLFSEDTMQIIHYELIRFDGDYVILRDRENGQEILVARAFIPDEAQEGSFLRYELLSYSMED